MAGFNVFGNVGHQLETRLYMDFLRMEGESNFLSFLPVESRRTLWADWYKGARKSSENYLDRQYGGLERRTRVVFRTADPKKEFFQKLIAHAGAATHPEDILNRCPGGDCADVTARPDEQRADRAMRRIADMRGLQVQHQPDVTFVRVDTGADSEDLAYTIIRNKALSNNSMLFEEGRRRVLEDDTLTVIKGYTGSYPNAFSRIPLEEIETRIDTYLGIRNKLDYYNYAKQHVIQRNSPSFWEESDWHYQTYLKRQPVEAGLFDMYRYHRIAEKTEARFSW